MPHPQLNLIDSLCQRRPAPPGDGAGRSQRVRGSHARRIGTWAGGQDLTYGADGRRETLGYAVFDVPVEVDAVERRFDAATFLDGQLPLVPRLYEGPYDIDRVLEIASGRGTVSGRGLRPREGVVIRPAVERYSPVTGGRAIAKAVSPAYPTRKGGTEYE